MTTGTSGITLDHTPASDGRIVPISALETRRTFVDNNLTTETFYTRGNVYKIFYTWDTNKLISSIYTGTYFKPTNLKEPIKSENGYPVKEYFPEHCLKLMASGVTYSKWVADTWAVGDNNWEEEIP